MGKIDRRFMVRLCECGACGMAFTRRRRRGVVGRNVYCSPECSVAVRNWRRSIVRPCDVCGKVYRSVLGRTRGSRFCSLACNGAAQRRRAEGDPHVTRGRRELAAPGLRRAARGRLLARWRREGRGCVYCSRPVECVDHVVPLVRGGTNHEGNLAPCCWRCNSRKSGLLVIEWRSGLRLSRRTLLPWVPRQFSPIVGEQLALDLAGW